MFALLCMMKICSTFAEEILRSRCVFLLLFQKEVAVYEIVNRSF